MIGLRRKTRAESEVVDPRTLLIRTLGADSPAVEAFRTLRTNIQFVGVRQTMQVIAVTSTGPGEGKSSVTANLASVMALTSGSRVILVDADLRKPVQAKTFGLSGRVGLANVLMGTIDLEDALLETDIEGLRLLPSGPHPPNPAELLGSAAMDDLITKLREAADMVIVDTPPTLPVTDAAVLAPKVDGVVLVIQAGRTPREAAEQAKRLLAATGARLLGTVLNRVTPSGGGYKHYYSYYSHSAQVEAEAATSSEK